jgi:putative ABC transport system permease protein
MRYLEYVREAFDALMRNKTRSLLTLLGMVIGVAAVDAVYGLSVGAANAINAAFLSGSDPSLVVYVDPKQADPDAARLNYRDAELVAANAGGAVARVAPFYSFFLSSESSRYVNVRNGNKKVAAFAFSWHADDSGLKLLAGSGFTDDEVASAARVGLISQDLAVHLYGSERSAIGQTLTVNGSRFEIVGVPDSSDGTGGKGYFGGSYYFILPYTTFHGFVPGPIDGLLIWAPSAGGEDAARSATLATLTHAHGAYAKYHVDSIREQLEQKQKIINVIAVSLTAIGAISLLVAGIGIMNIMLVAVTERTREIGIRKSIGARRGEIVAQFLTEASFLSLIGGAAGLLLAIGAIALAKEALERTLGSIAIPWPSVVIYAFLFSLGVGLTFGVYPAARASRLDPVEALRA